MPEITVELYDKPTTFTVVKIYVDGEILENAEMREPIIDQIISIYNKGLEYDDLKKKYDKLVNHCKAFEPFKTFLEGEVQES